MENPFGCEPFSSSFDPVVAEDIMYNRPETHCVTGPQGFTFPISVLLNPVRS